MEKEHPEFIQDAAILSELAEELSKVVVGQVPMVRSLLVSILTGGHVLLEGVPGLAKTLSVKALASILEIEFHRIQFTPDLLPSDLIGTLIYEQGLNEFKVKKGPIFTNLLLADEINRAPAKVQSALLECMAERQVTLGDETYSLPDPFLVLATQNPIEQEGTYSLPEAQLDRFMLKAIVGYPTKIEEKMILERMSLNNQPKLEKKFKIEKLLKLKESLDKVHLDSRLEDYIVRIILATRPGSDLSPEEANLERLKEVQHRIRMGASPRATIALTRASKAMALFEKRHFVLPEDIKMMALDVLRHRVKLTFDAEGEGVSPDKILHDLLSCVFVP